MPMKPHLLPHPTLPNRCLLFLTFVILSLQASAQNVEMERYSLGMFSILLPENCQEIESEEARQYGCIGWVTPDKDFICTVCFFNFDEGFDPEKRFREEAEGVNVDLDNSERFLITTGTEQVLRCALTQRAANNYLAIGLYPDFKKEKGVFLCMASIGPKEPTLLANVLASFRLMPED